MPKMKKQSLSLFLLLLLGGTAFGQSFEGIITYSSKFQGKSIFMSAVQWTDLMGENQEYFIKGGNYKSVGNGTLVEWQLYRSAENNIYTKTSESDSALWNDAYVQADEVLSAEVNKGALEVLGYRCDELILTCKSGVQKYYYHAAFPVDPEVFVNHRLGNWYAFVSRSKALPLKMIIDSENFLVERTAVAIKPLKLDAATFELPAGMKTKKSPN